MTGKKAEVEYTGIHYHERQTDGSSLSLNVDHYSFGDNKGSEGMITINHHPVRGEECVQVWEGNLEELCEAINPSMD